MSEFSEEDTLGRTFFSKDNETYSLKIITDWLKQKNISYVYADAPVDRFGMYHHGVRVSLKNSSSSKPVELSVQTHPSVAGWAFAETLQIPNMLSDTRHATPEKLFEFLNELLTTEVIEE
jgi:hypothetical protein